MSKKPDGERGNHPKSGTLAFENLKKERGLRSKARTEEERKLKSAQNRRKWKEKQKTQKAIESPAVAEASEVNEVITINESPGVNESVGLAKFLDMGETLNVPVSLDVTESWNGVESGHHCIELEEQVFTEHMTEQVMSAFDILRYVVAKLG